MIDYIDKKELNSWKKTALNNCNIEFILDNVNIYYYDQLSFGTLKIVNNEEELKHKLNSIGPDIMDKNTTYKLFEEQITKKNNLEKIIGDVIVNQKIISGIGNYLRSDILWLSCISPFRKTKDLLKDEIEKIYKNSKLLTWGDYNIIKGKKMGYISYDDKLPKDYKRNFFVYKCDNDIYGNKIVCEKLYGNREERNIYWVKEIQK